MEVGRRFAVVDPGKNTGLCWVERVVGGLRWELWSCSPLQAVAIVDDFAKYRDYVTIVAERFTVTNIRHTRQYDALEVIGALRYVAHKRQAWFELQGRSDRMRVPREVALRFAQPKDDDQESALRHAVVAAVRHGLIDPVTYVVRSN